MVSGGAVSVSLSLSLCRGCVRDVEGSGGSGGAGLNPITCRVAHAFNDLTNIRISDDDGLPMFLCHECLAALNNAYQFKKQCLQSDILLKTQLKDDIDDVSRSRKSSQDSERLTEIQKNYVSEVVLEKPDDDDDFYVLVINKGENSDSDSSKQNFHDPLESHKDTRILIGENEFVSNDVKSILPDVINAHPSKNIADQKNDVLLNNKKARLEWNIGPLIASEDIQNTIPLWKENNIVVSSSIFKSDSACDSPLSHSYEIPVENNSIYTQEEIEVDNTEESYEIIDCNISELNSIPKKLNHSAIPQEDGTLLCDCGESFKELSSHERHVNSFNKLLCPVCGKGFEFKEVITGHMLLHEKSDSHLQCPFCDKVIRRNLLTVHINTNHGPNRPTCYICQKTFATEHNRKRHTLTHFSSKDYECDICHVKFNHKIAMQNHRLMHEKSKELRCPNCFKEFSTETELKAHWKESCETKCDNSTDSDQKYICNKCGKTYSEESSLQTHIEFVHGFEYTTLLCAECGETFSDKKAMLAHSNSHRPNRPKSGKKYSCSVCLKPFVALAMLKMHERVHTNERPYKCNKCAFAFKTKSHLATHQLTHTQEKRFGCSVCMKFFALKGNLIVHLRTHTGERPYVCNVCSQAFIDSKYLKKHKLRRHAREAAAW